MNRGDMTMGQLIALAQEQTNTLAVMDSTKAAASAMSRKLSDLETTLAILRHRIETDTGERS